MHTQQENTQFKLNRCMINVPTLNNKKLQQKPANTIYCYIECICIKMQLHPGLLVI